MIETKTCRSVSWPWGQELYSDSPKPEKEKQGPKECCRKHKFAVFNKHHQMK